MAKPHDINAEGGEVTRLLVNWGNGDKAALDNLLPIVYQELKQMARRYLRAESAAHTLQATALVHDAYMRLVDQTRVSWQNRAHFFAIASEMLRRILVDYARARHRQKRGGGMIRVTLHDVHPAKGDDLDLLELDEALTRLKEIDPKQVKIIELRYFAGLSIEETADIVGVSTATVKREWSMARAWLYREIRKGPEPEK